MDRWGRRAMHIDETQRHIQYATFSPHRTRPRPSQPNCPTVKYIKINLRLIRGIAVHSAAYVRGFN